MLVEKLYFQPLNRSGLTSLRCTHCGNHGDPNNWLVSHLCPYTSLTMRVSFPVCSDRCREEFIKDSQVETFIWINITSLAEQLELKLNHEYNTLLKIFVASE